MPYDLILRGGTVIDGTGALPGQILTSHGGGEVVAPPSRMTAAAE